MHTCGYPIKTTKVSDHVESFKKLVDSSINDWQTDLINVHSGVDSWTLEQSIEFFQRCQEIEKTLPVKVAHETHRQRAFYSPYQTMQILKECPDIKLNTDLSHWIVVCERLFTDEQFWPGLLETLKQRSLMIHARVSTP